MSLDEFMDCTPRYFDALVQRHRETEERAERKQEFMFAQLTAMVANSGFLRWDKAPTPPDFMPSEWDKQQKQPRKRRRSRKVIAAEMEATLNKVFG
jgi:hypothetical protein